MTVQLTAGDVMRVNDLVRRRYPDKTAVGRASRQGVGCIVDSAFGVMYGQPLHPTIYGQAAALMEGIVRTHPFRDGNKRTALLAACVLLDLNGRPVTIPKDAVRFVVNVAKSMGSTSEDTAMLVDEVARWLERNAASGKNPPF